MSNDVEYEVELVGALQSGRKNLNRDVAYPTVYGFAVGLDMTRRNLQSELKKAGRPWEIAKAFEHSAPCELLTPKELSGLMKLGNISLTVNDALKRKENLNQMI